MKMANMDSAFDFMFTNPKNDGGVSNARMLCKVMYTCSSLLQNFDRDLGETLGKVWAGEISRSWRDLCNLARSCQSRRDLSNLGKISVKILHGSHVCVMNNSAGDICIKWIFLLFENCANLQSQHFLPY